jgi:hypothetical protein
MGREYDNLADRFERQHLITAGRRRYIGAGSVRGDEFAVGDSTNISGPPRTPHVVGVHPMMNASTTIFRHVSFVSREAQAPNPIWVSAAWRPPN